VLVEQNKFRISAHFVMPELISIAHSVRRRPLPQVYPSDRANSVWRVSELWVRCLEQTTVLFRVTVYFTFLIPFCPLKSQSCSHSPSSD